MLVFSRRVIIHRLQERPLHFLKKAFIKHFLNFNSIIFQMLLFETKQRFKKEYFSSRINYCAEQGQ
jgi:hypothetical protein